MPHRTRRIEESIAASGQAADALAETPLHERVAYEGGMLRLQRDIVRCPDGHVAYREFVRHPGAVMVIPMADEDRVILERQFRYPLGRSFIEIPAGKLDAGEEPLACAQRELMEETGYRAASWQHLGRFHNAIGCSDEKIEIFLARGLHLEAAAKTDAGEVLEVFSVPWQQLLEWVRTGEVTDAKTIIGALWLEKVLAGAWTL